MGNLLFGLETEYAFTAFERCEAEPIDREEALDEIMEIAQSRFPYLETEKSNSIFLANGSRFYIDSGEHPEFCTPECSHPADAVRYLLAGERMLEELAGRYVERHSEVEEATFFKSNVDYFSPEATWGAHESYLHKAEPERLPQELIPFLVSRIIYTGSGGFNSKSPGLEFLLSPRAPHFSCDISGSSTSSRGIFHTKDESLSGNGYHRCHIICGESLCSESANWLKVAATALVLAVIEKGRRPGMSVRLKDSPAALLTIARDPTLKAKVDTIQGKKISALKIQKHYLQEVEKCLGEAYMPSWAEDACQVWRRVLEKLDENPMILSTSHDAYIKYALYTRFLKKHGVSWGWANHWTKIMPGIKDGLLSFFQTHILNYSGQLKKFLLIRHKLMEMDTRFAQLGSRGIFASLSRAGVLNHHVQGVEFINEAVESPPLEGRARLRGEHVKIFSKMKSRYLCNWSFIIDTKKKKILNLSDPFDKNPAWRKYSPREVIF